MNENALQKVRFNKKGLNGINEDNIDTSQAAMALYNELK